MDCPQMTSQPISMDFESGEQIVRQFQDGQECFRSEIEDKGKEEMGLILTEENNGLNREGKESLDGQPRWKQSICSRASSISSKSSRLAIHHRYSILTKRNPKISSCLKKITEEIKSQLLHQKPSAKSHMNLTPNQYPVGQNKPMENGISNKILQDKQIVKQSCFRGLLKQSKIDNDVQSDEEDLNMGIRFMYGELLYSVGSEMVNHREKEAQLKKTKLIAKKARRIQNNKQNININLVNVGMKNKGEGGTNANREEFNGLRVRQ